MELTLGSCHGDFLSMFCFPAAPWSGRWVRPESADFEQHGSANEPQQSDDGGDHRGAPFGHRGRHLCQSTTLTVLYSWEQ